MTSSNNCNNVGQAYESLDEISGMDEFYLGPMNHLCEICRNPDGYIDNPAIYFAQEPMSQFCCFKQTVFIHPLHPVPQIEKIIRSKESRGNYLDNIREINNALAFISMGVEIDLPEGRGPYVFRIHGQIYHRIGALIPPVNKPPKYASLYIIDPRKAFEARCQNPANQNVDKNLLEKLQLFLSRVNPYAKAFRHLFEMEQKEQE